LQNLVCRYRWYNAGFVVQVVSRYDSYEFCSYLGGLVGRMVVVVVVVYVYVCMHTPLLYTLPCKNKQSG
jgi:hypothetical protein